MKRICSNCKYFRQSYISKFFNRCSNSDTKIFIGNEIRWTVNNCGKDRNLFEPLEIENTLTEISDIPPLDYSKHKVGNWKN